MTTGESPRFEVAGWNDPITGEYYSNPRYQAPVQPLPEPSVRMWNDPKTGELVYETVRPQVVGGNGETI